MAGEGCDTVLTMIDTVTTNLTTGDKLRRALAGSRMGGPELGPRPRKPKTTAFAKLLEESGGVIARDDAPKWWLTDGEAETQLRLFPQHAGAGQ